nr:TonB-dependent receptor plug domain-containing protein [Ningiella sp. W23]
MGKLPDRNAAEAVQRIPGVSIERDQGEGRFVAVRGLPAQWSSASINGDRLPTAEEETTSRATAFDFFLVN